jgi:hypothetical protein
MFAIADRRWLEQGVANVLGGIKICSLSQIHTEIVFSFITSQTERQHHKLGVHISYTNPGPTSVS